MDDDDDALALIGTPEADVFAMALDLMGWKIVCQDDPNRVWPMNSDHGCPAWAESYSSWMFPKSK
jgi:hypothetical protein